MSFKRVLVDEWDALQKAQTMQNDQIKKLYEQLGMQYSSSEAGTSPPPTMDERVDALDAEENREDEVEEARREGIPRPLVSVEPGAPPPPPRDSTASADADDTLDSLPPASRLSRAKTAPKPAYPPLGDEAEKQPGFLMTTKGNDYKWVGKDSAKVVAGNYRSITAGERVDFVGEEKKSTVVGSVTNKYLSGKTDTIHGPMTQDYIGDSNRTVIGNETRTMTGNRTFTITGDREDNMTGWKHEYINGDKTEIITGTKLELVTIVKSETILGAKHSTVAGAKIDSIDGLKVDINKKGERVKSESALWDIGKTLGAKAAKGTWNIEKLRVKGKRFDINSKQINIIGETKQIGDIIVEGELKTTKKTNIDNGAITT